MENGIRKECISACYSLYHIECIQRIMKSVAGESSNSPLDFAVSLNARSDIIPGLLHK